MGIIHYDFDNGSLLDVMVPTLNIHGNYTNAQLPTGLAGTGIYMIINTINNPFNRYVGISNNLAQRFQPRLEVLNELGFNAATMQQLGMYWGKVSSRNASANNTNLGSWNVVQNHKPANITIDNHNFNFEHLLIRVFVNCWRTGNTVSNNQLAYNLFINSTNRCLVIIVTWCHSIFNAGRSVNVLLPNNLPNTFNNNYNSAYDCLNQNSPAELTALQNAFPISWNSIRNILLRSQPIQGSI